MRLLARAQEKTFWKEVREKACYEPFRRELTDLWDRFCTQDVICEMKYSDFTKFSTQGTRGEYEGPYFQRRQGMNAATFLSLIYPEEPKYLERLMDILFAVCNEYTWCLPAHYGSVEVENDTFIDLFAAETGFALAEIYTMLEDRLEPLIKLRIRREIDRRIVDSFIRSAQKPAWWEKATNNWTAVCAGSVGCAVMLMRPELMEVLKPRFDKAMECYLSGFAEDGICVEGCAYWGYGFGFFVTYADMIKTFTAGETDYFTRAKVRSIATYLQKMFLSGTSCVSFSDGGTHTRYHLGLVHYLKKVYPQDVVVYPRKYAYHYDGCARFCLHLRAALWYCEELDCDEPPAEDVTYYAEGSQWFIRKTPSYGFAAKGGHNHDSHNHNDVGAFIFAREGKQWLTDPGSGVYNRAYFKNETRYTYFHTSSLGHSVPIVGGECQKAGKEYRAENCRIEDGDFVMDMASAYGMEDLRSLERRFSCRENGVTVTDRFDYCGDGELRERLVCTVQPEQTAAGSLLVGACQVTYDATPVEDVKIEKQITPGCADCYTVDIILKKGVRSFSFTVE